MATRWKPVESSAPPMIRLGRLNGCFTMRFLCLCPPLFSSFETLQRISSEWMKHSASTQPGREGGFPRAASNSSSSSDRISSLTRLTVRPPQMKDPTNHSFRLIHGQSMVDSLLEWKYWWKQSTTRQSTEQCLSPASRRTPSCNRPGPTRSRVWLRLWPSPHALVLRSALRIQSTLKNGKTLSLLGSVTRLPVPIAPSTTISSVPISARWVDPIGSTSEPIKSKLWLWLQHLKH